MRSLYVRILLASLLTVVASLFVFIAITRLFVGRAIGQLVGSVY